MPDLGVGVMMTKDEYDLTRKRMVEEQIAARGIRDSRVFGCDGFRAAALLYPSRMTWPGHMQTVHCRSATDRQFRSHTSLP